MDWTGPDKDNVTPIFYLKNMEIEHSRGLLEDII